jgi:hypothetical protein
MMAEWADDVGPATFAGQPVREFQGVSVPTAPCIFRRRRRTRGHQDRHRRHADSAPRSSCPVHVNLLLVEPPPVHRRQHYPVLRKGGSHRTSENDATICLMIDAEREADVAWRADMNKPSLSHAKWRIAAVWPENWMQAQETFHAICRSVDLSAEMTLRRFEATDINDFQRDVVRPLKDWNPHGVVVRLLNPEHLKQLRRQVPARAFCVDHGVPARSGGRMRGHRHRRSHQPGPRSLSRAWAAASRVVLLCLPACRVEPHHRVPGPGPVRPRIGL